MPVNEKRKICFVHIPKTGGSSIDYAVLGNLQLNNFNLLGRIIKIKDYYRFSSHCTLQEIIDIKPHIIKQNFQFITCVRNPFDKLKSEYFHLIKHKMKHPILGTIKNLTFSEFIKKIAINFDKLNDPKNNSTKEDYTIHFVPQNKFLINNANIKVKIYKFENFDEIIKDLNIKKHLNGNPLSKKVEYYKIYDSDTIKIVESLYKDDLLAFNYSFTENKK